MARPPRVILPGVPLHITQRGVDRCPTFIADEDFAFYRWALGEARAAAGCAVHAYVLMTNHVHLLVTPDDASGPARMMVSIGRRYVRYFNDRYRRTGTLWEGRYRTALVDSGSYLLACSRYIEMNPVRAGLVGEPAAYTWSSFRYNACGDDDPIVVPHRHYVAMGVGRDARCAAYRALFATELTSGVLATLRSATRVRPQVHPSAYRELIEAAAAGSEAPLGHRRAQPGDDARPGQAMENRFAAIAT